MNGSLDLLYKGISEHFDIGTWQEFSAKMQTPDDRKRFFEIASTKVDLGGYDEYEAKLSKKVDPKALDQKDLLGTKKEKGRIITKLGNLFDDTEDVMVDNLRASSIIKDLGIKVEGPDDDQKLDKTGRHDDVRLTNEWGKVLIINKSDKDYLKKLNAFTKKTNDARHHKNNVGDVAFEDWGVLTSTSGFVGREEAKRINEIRSKTSQKDYEASLPELTTDAKVINAVTNTVHDVMGFVGDVFDYSYKATLGNTGDAAMRHSKAMQIFHDAHGGGLWKTERERISSENLKKKNEYEAWQKEYSVEDEPSNLESNITKAAGSPPDNIKSPMLSSSISLLSITL